MECFALCSIHITSYSTTTFECAEFGIPTIFLKSLNEDFNMFETDFKYPFNVEMIDIIKDYSKYSDEVISWRKKYYSYLCPIIRKKQLASYFKLRIAKKLLIH